MKLGLLLILLGLGLADDTDCNHDNIENAEHTCQFVKDYCDPESIINFNVFYYCDTHQKLYIMLPLSILIIILCFYILGTTSDNYLAPALAKMAKILGMSQNLAGVTFLALANGAPDVFSSIAASGADDTGLSVALGALVGSGFFVSSLVFSLVVFTSSVTIKLRPSSFLRDAFFYIAGLILIGCYSFIGTVNIFMGICVLLLYFIYVAFVAINEWRLKREAKRKGETFGLTSPPLSPEEQGPNLNMSSDLKDYPNLFESIAKAKEQLGEDFDIAESPPVNDSAALENSTDQPAKNGQSLRLQGDQEHRVALRLRHTESLSSSLLQGHIQRSTFKDSIKKRTLKKHSTLRKKIKKVKSQVVWSLVKAQYWIKKTGNSEKNWKEMNCFQKFIFIVLDTPLDFLRRLTIPPFEDANWSRLFATLCPPCCIIFFFFCTQLNTLTVNGVHIWWPLTIAMIPFSVALYCTSHARSAPHYAKVSECIEWQWLSFPAFIMSIVWIWFISNILVDQLELIGYISGIKTSFLGLTMLALGNSIPDLVADLAVSKLGFGELAITGAIAGPLFNLLLGMGISLTRSIAQDGDQQFKYTDEIERLPLICLVLMILTLIIIVIWVSATKFKLRKGLAVFLLINFFIFIGVASLVAFAF